MSALKVHPQNLAISTPGQLFILASDYFVTCICVALLVYTDVYMCATVHVYSYVYMYDCVCACVTTRVSECEHVLHVCDPMK